MNPSTMQDRLWDNEKPRACRQCLYFRENGNGLVKIRDVKERDVGDSK